MNELLRVYPQGPVTPIAATLRKDVESADSLIRGGADTEAVAVAVGDTIPLIFAKRQGARGGVFISPKLVRIGVSNTCSTVSFQQALILSDGQLPAVNINDIWHGNAKLAAVPQGSCVTSYGALPQYQWTANIVSTLKKTEVYKHPDQVIGSGLQAIAQTVEYISGGTELEVQAQSEYATSMAIKVSRIRHEVNYRGATQYFRGYQRYNKDSVTLPTASTSNARLTYPDNFNREKDIKVMFKDYLGAQKEDYINVAKTTFVPGSVTTGSVFVLDDRGSKVPINEIVLDAGKTLAIVHSSWSDKRLSSSPLVYSVKCNGIFTVKLPEHATEQEVIDQYRLEVTETRSIPCPVPAAINFTGSGGSFSGLTVLGVTGSCPSTENKHRQQFHVFVRNGVIVDQLAGGAGSSSLFPDLVRYLMAKIARVPDLLIDNTSLLSAAQFNAAQGLHFDGILASPVNLREYLSRVAPLFLLRLTQNGGKFGLRSVLPLNGASFETGTIVPYATFDAASIIEGSLTVQYVELSQRKPFCALMVWREQPEDRPGVIRNTEVRYSGTAVDGPFEQYDLSDFCTSEAHATMVGRYILSQRRHVTHSITFRADPTVSVSLSVGDVVRVQHANTASAGQGLSLDRLYLVERLSEDATGVLEIAGSYFPVDGTGRSLITADVTGTI